MLQRGQQFDLFEDTAEGTPADARVPADVLHRKQVSAVALLDDADLEGARGKREC